MREKGFSRGRSCRAKARLMWGSQLEQLEKNESLVGWK